jgi:tetratricopeptide (TPR) repeat protein
VLLVALGSGIAAGIGRFGSPISVAKRTWHTFTHPAQRSAASSHFITGAGNNRYDFWRVAAHQFTSAPVLGAGVDNFGADYVQRRRSTEEPLYPHSLEAELLGGLGVIGFLLFATFAFAAARRCIAAARAQPERAVPGMTALALFSYWLAHGSVDWLWEFPALTGPVLAAVASCRLPPTLAAPEEEARVRAPSLARWLVIVPAVVFASLALIPAWLGARDVSLAAAGWRTDRGLAYQRLSNAASLNKLSDQPYVVAGTIAERRRDWSSSQRYFMRALGRNKDDWYAYFELGIAHAKLGDRTAALAALAHAHRLDPREPLISEVSSAVARRQTFSVAALDSDFVERDKRIATR